MSNTYTGVTSKQFQDFIALPAEGPFQMVNLLKFKKKIEGTETSGAKGYAKYMEAALPFFEKSNAKVLYHGKPLFGLIGPEEELEWDKILIVEYASKKNFLSMITAEGYPAKMRSQVLADSRLIVCTTKQ